MSAPSQYRCDTVVIGGGIAALWTAATLKAAGQTVAVLCQGELGSGQTITSQGVIHGGLKYALGGKLNEASEALSAMPARWLAAMRGEGSVDLSGLELLSDHQILWTQSGLISQAAGFFGSKTLRGRVAPLSKSHFPTVFSSSHYKGKLFRVEEPVINPQAVITRLADLLRDETRAVAWGQNAKIQSDCGEIHHVSITGEDGSLIELRANRWVFAAGAGNGSLLSQIDLESPQMQLRPLHQVIVRKADLPDFFSVCIGTGPKPPLVATTHRDSIGRTVWYLGGELAEAAGVARSEREQIDFARAFFAKHLPWIDLAGAEWATCRIDRAEPRTLTGARPPGAYCERFGNVIVTWPTKLALAPALADLVLRETSTSDFAASSPLPLPIPQVARPPWDMP